MLEYARLQNDPQRIAVIAEWFSDQWRLPVSHTTRELSAPRNDLPAPVIAIQDDEVVGVLTFTFHRVAEVSDKELWINALYVREDLRGMGIGKQLLSLGMNAAKDSGVKQLFVYTEIPLLYAKQGWQEFRAKNFEGMWVYVYRWA